MSRRLFVGPWWALVACFVALGLSEQAPAQTLSFDHQQLINWGLETQAEIEQTLGLANSPLYAETARLNGTQTGGTGGVAFAWPLSTQFRVLNSLTLIDPATYTPQLRAFSDRFHADFWWNSGTKGYSCCDGGNDRYYDDNAHIAVALMESYRITSDVAYLDRARDVYRFLIAGAVPGHPGGSYWRVGDNSFIDSAAVLQGARAGFMLYEETGATGYLNDAIARVQWAEEFTQLSEGTFYEKLFLTGPKAGTAGDYPLVNFAGFGISANLAWFDATGDRTRLVEAQRIGNASLNRYINKSNGALNDEGYWTFELVDALVDLYEHDDNPKWVNAAGDAMEWLHANRLDPEGHYGVLWGRGGVQTTALTEWSLNDMASVARSYLHVGLSSPQGLAGDYNDDGFVDAADYTIWRDARGTNALLPNDRGFGGIIGTRHLNQWRTNYGATLADSVAVPEPTTLALLACVGVLSATRCVQ